MFLIFNISFLIFIRCGHRLPDRPLSGSVDRRVLAELFTTTWCTNCPAAVKSLIKLSDSLSNNLVLLAYHPSANDPFGTVKTDARINSYGISGFPTVIFDGTEGLLGIQSYEMYLSKIKERIELKSPIRILLMDSVSANQVSGKATVIVVDSLSGNFYFNLVVYEDSLYYPAINGETTHRYVVRDIYTERPLSLNPNDTVFVDFQFPIANYQLSYLSYAVFVSHPQTKEVIQCAFHNLRTPLYYFLLVSPETLKTVPLGNLANFPFEIINTGSYADSLIIDIPDSLSLPLGWSLSLCDTAVCLGRPYTVYCADGDSVRGLKVEIGPQNSPDTCFVTIRVSSQSSPGLIREQRLYVQTAK